MGGVPLNSEELLPFTCALQQAVCTAEKNTASFCTGLLDQLISVWSSFIVTEPFSEETKAPES